MHFCVQIEGPLVNKKLTFPSRRRLKAYAAIGLTLLILKVVWVVSFAVRDEDKADLLKRRAYLIGRLNNGDAMPSNLKDQFDGEWALVSHSMTAMALANLAFLYPETAPEARDQLERLIPGVLKEEVKTFDRSLWGNEEPLQSTHGHIGYLGHLNIALAAYAFLGGRNQEYLNLFDQVSQMLEKRMSARPNFNEETYPDEIYLADNAAVIASLALYHRFRQTPDKLTAQWCREVDQHYRDEAGKILIFRIQPDGRPVPEGRGSGAGWNTFFLFYADPEFAAAEFARLKAGYYKELPLGLGAIREWPKGQNKAGDVDSGPVILGLSPSATGFAVSGARVSHDQAMFRRLMRTAEVVGCTIGGQRTHYLCAPLVGESIMLAMRTTTPWDLRFCSSSKNARPRR